MSNTIPQDAPHPRLSRRINLPIEELCQRYQQGESEKLLAISYGVSRSVISRHLIQAGIVRRTPAEVNRIAATLRTPEQNHALAQSAHAAKRGVPTPIEVKRKLALTNERKQLHVSPLERMLQEWLAQRNIPATPQKAVGPYNIDLVVDRVAIEIFGGGWHSSGRHFQRASTRLQYLLSEGYSILIIWANDRWGYSSLVADYIAQFISQNHETAIHVLTGQGKELPPESTFYKRAVGAR